MRKIFLICSVLISSLNSVQAAKLAEREELKRQLLSVETGMNHVYLERMYPCILDQAGKEMDSNSVVSLIRKAKNIYLRKLIPEIKRKDRTDIIVQITKASLIQFAPQLIRAILPNDRDVAEQAIYIYNYNYQYSQNLVPPPSETAMSDI